MARCELTGKSVVVKNKVSHSNIKTKSRAYPNIQKKRVFSPTLNQFVRLKMAASTIKSLEHSGGFDKFILNQPEAKLSKRALAVRQRIRRKISNPSKKGKTQVPAAEASPA